MKKNKKPISPIAVGIMIAVICLALVIIFKPADTVTGSAIEIKYHGVSDYPLAEQKGKMQTYVRLTQPTLKQVEGDTSDMAVEISSDIMQTINYKEALKEMYVDNPPVELIHENSLDIIRDKAETMADAFKSNIKCLNRLSKDHNNDEEFRFVIASELVYHKCRDYSDNPEVLNLYGAKVKHTYFTMDGTELCYEETYTLFTADKNTGEIGSNIANC